MENGGQSRIPTSPISAPRTVAASPTSHDTEMKSRDFSECKIRTKQESNSLASGDNSISEICSGVEVVRGYVQKRIQLSQQFISDVTEEIINPLDAALKRSALLEKRLDSEAAALVRVLTSEKKALADSLVQFKNSKKAVSKRLPLLGTRSSAEDHVTAGLVCFAADQAEECYASTARRYIQVRHEYKESMGLILNQLEEMEKSRLTLLKESSDKFFIFEFALNRGIQYELETAFRQIETEPTVDEDISKFVDASGNAGTAEGVEDVVESPRSPMVSVAARGSIAEAGIAEIQSVELKLIQMVWSESGSLADIPKDVLEAAEEPLGTGPGRVSFCRALTQQESQLSTLKQLENLGKLLNISLARAEADLDSETGRRIAALALRFFVTVDGRKRFIQSEIYHHTFWNHIRFWEEALTLTIADELIAMHLDRGAEDGDDGPRIRAHVFSDLSIDRFGTYLLVFGISVNSAVEIVKRVLARQFGGLHPGAAQLLTERLMNSIKAAAEKQERNASNFFQSKPTSPTASGKLPAR